MPRKHNQVEMSVCTQGNETAESLTHQYHVYEHTPFGCKTDS
ncbi:hypothetical protein EDB37_1010142 [Vibrio crassostreae]|nr:hypothetical protein EDB37_1010142 [Vibrio crassostreae]